MDRREVRRWTEGKSANGQKGSPQMDRNTWVRMLNFETFISLLNKWPKLIHPQILSLRKFFTNHVTNHSVKFSNCKTMLAVEKKQLRLRLFWSQLGVVKVNGFGRVEVVGRFKKLRKGLVIVCVHVCVSSFLLRFSCRFPIGFFRRF